MQMLTCLKLENYRCFSKSPQLKFAKINVFIGPNNAGKSTIMSAIEVLLQTASSNRTFQPLDFTGQPQFASFSSVLRKHWAPNEPKPIAVVVDSEWNLSQSSETKEKVDLCFWAKYKIQGLSTDDRSYVNSAEYGLVRKGRRGAASIKVHHSGSTGSVRQYQLDRPRGTVSMANQLILFDGILPFIFPNRTTKKASISETDLFSYASRYRHELQPHSIVVVRPHRPVPRSFYVLDDPSLNEEDRALISSLIDLWGRKDDRSLSVRKQLIDSLRTLRLANYIDVRRSIPSSPSIVKIIVSTGSTRKTVTIADVGFGLSQALPLVAKDAAMSQGYFLSYQPEVHLHPFAQSRLADLFVASSNRGNAIFIETHSEHLVLRLQFLVAKGEIKPEDVRVFCVESAGKSSSVRQMTFDKKGIPVTPWPRGFLDTNFTVARELAEARAQT